jgi:hypothetical protein
VSVRRAVPQGRGQAAPSTAPVVGVSPLARLEQLALSPPLLLVLLGLVLILAWRVLALRAQLAGGLPA